MLEFTSTADNSPIFVDPEAVKVIYVMDGYTAIRLDDGSEWLVTEEAADVAQQIAEWFVAYGGEDFE